MQHCHRSSKAILYLIFLQCLTAIAVGDDKATPGGTNGKKADKSRGAASAERLFTLKVLPLLKQKCFGCHGGDAKDVRGELNLVTRKGMLRGGESETPSLIPGKPDQSPLYQAILWNELEMPPKENDRLTKKEAEYFRLWIKAGAPWPSAERQTAIRKKEWSVRKNEDGELITTSGGLSDEWTYRRYQPDDVWAVRPVSMPKLPATAGSPIDHFVDSQLKQVGLTPAPRANYRVLIRRATLDLTGLPPTPEEVEQFRVAFSKDPNKAWQQLIDRLLESERYGERWGRHWLDVTRYADTGGMSNDFERSNMWRYRDYVIRSFNRDKPYNQFIIEQLAGDELADASVKARLGGAEVRKTQLSGSYTEQEAEWLVASGFLRLGPWDNAMVMPAEARQIYLDDLVNITGQTFLATALRCCKCHDHKFDPIPTRDYYRIYAAFSTTQMAERKVPFLSTESRDGFKQGKAHVERMLAFAVAEKNKLIEKRETAARKWFKEHGLPYKNDKERRDLPDEKKPPRHVGLDYVEQGQLKVREQDEWIWNRRLERYQPMAQSVFNADSVNIAWNHARKLRITFKAKQGKPLVNHILLGGALTAPGDQVGPGVLSAIAVPVSTRANAPYRLPDATNGRRLGLAKWIANPNNSLTTRTIVNRIWQYHFGRGLAANANNFGAKGARPSHPRLLDYLAADFVENGWKMKRVHRAIMLSEAYQRDSRPADAERTATVDPNNRWLSHFSRRRLSAEEIRDSVLAITGELRHSSGGVPIMPEINLEVALQPRMIQFSLAPAYQPSRTPEERNRRSIYAYQVRGQADPFTELFNQPNPNESCELRESASVTPQALTLFNSDLMVDRSIAMARRLQGEEKTVAAQVRRAFELTFGRSPTGQEAKSLTGYVVEMTEYQQKVKPAPSKYPRQITRSLVEEFSGRPFKYQEILPIFERYEPDHKPADVGATTRALADMCLLLLNANEFIYVE